VWLRLSRHTRVGFRAVITKCQCFAAAGCPSDVTKMGRSLLVPRLSETTT
jgi:hypothetical protein